MRRPVPFGKYILLDRISIGGMAEVFKAKSFGVEGFEKVIAIKRILPSMGEDEDFISMFIDEAKIAGQLAHANIGQIHELGEVDGSHFIAMEYIQGRDLLQLQKRYRKLGKKIPVEACCFILMKICEGLHYAHKKRDVLGTSMDIVHRDCSPQNVVISYEGEVKLIDFGIARAASRSSRTQAGVLKGKFAYMSPEQVRGLPLDRRSDIFSLGTILFECLTGTRLFNAESDFSTLERVRNAEFDRNAMKAAGVPPAVEKVVLKALERSTEDRYQWCSEMRADLLTYLQSVDNVYTTRKLGEELRTVFAKELQRDRELMDSYARIGQDGDTLEDAEIEVLVDGQLGEGTGEAPPLAARATPASSFASGSRPRRSTSDDDSDFSDGATEVFGDVGMAELFDSMGVSTPTDSVGESDEPKVEVRNQSESSAPAIVPATPTPTPPPRPPVPVMNSQFTDAGASGHFARPAATDSGVQPVGLPDPRNVSHGVSASVPLPGRRPSTTHKRQRGKKDILIGLAVAVAAALLFLAVKVFFLSSEPKVTTAAQGVLVVMVGDSQAAEVFLDGKKAGAVEAGKTLTVNDLKPGSYDIKVAREGAEACAEKIKVTSERTKYYNCDFAGAKNSSVLFEGLMAGDKVVINGKEVTLDALDKALPMVSNKSHSVAISRDGKLLDEFTLKLKEGEERRRQVKQADPGTEVPSEPDAGVEEPSVEFPADELPLEKDPVRKSIVLDDTPLKPKPKPKPKPDPVEKPPLEKQVDPNAPGYFTAFTKPWARVYIDGKDTGKQTPITTGGKIKLKPGIHKITFEAEGKKHNFSVTIKPGKTSRLAKILTP
jgi:serine/threonine protein kinase